MKIWALADLHLHFGVPDKNMDVFGPKWAHYTEKIKKNWEEVVQPEDLVLIAGDISWALKTHEVIPDLNWIDQLPGKKIMIKGNHDHWWTSKNKVENLLPPSIKIIYNNALSFNGVSIGGARLWDTEEFDFNSFICFQKNPREKEKSIDLPLQRSLFEREVNRLLLSLEQMEDAPLKIVMTHYPPIGADLAPSRVSTLLEKYNIDICVFGHLHSVKENSLPFGTKNGVRYVFTACDYLDFKPVLLDTK